MAVNLKTVKDTVNLAAGVLAAAAGVVDGAKAARFRCRWSREKRCRRGNQRRAPMLLPTASAKGFGAAAEGVARQPARWGMPRRAFQDSKGRRGSSEEDRCRQAINIERRVDGDAPARVHLPAGQSLRKLRSTATICPAAISSRHTAGMTTIRTSATISEYTWGQVSVWRDDIASIPTRLGDPDVYADYKYRQNILLFV